MAELSTALVSMFNQSLESSMAEIEQAGEWDFSYSDKTTDANFNEAVFLTMSSHLFRIFIALNFERKTISDLVSVGLGTKKENIDKQSTDDYLLELGNSVCGFFKRILGEHIPALGMSTPNLLQVESFSYMDSFHITSQSFQWVKFRGKPVLLAGYYYCPYKEEEIDIELHQFSNTNDSGELELF